MTIYDQRPWIANYDPGVPNTLEPYPKTTLHQLLRDSAQRVPSQDAVLFSAKLPLLGRQVTRMCYADLDAQSDAMAAALVAMGLQKGDRVALVLPNIPAFPIAFYGILKAGGIVAGTNPTYPPERMRYQIDDCDAEIVICLSLFYQTIKQIQPKTKVKHVIVTNVKEYLPGLAKPLFALAKEKKDGHYIAQLGEDDLWFQDVLRRHARQSVSVYVNSEDVALFQYTGGTTGVSKGAMQTHAALVANTKQMECSWKLIQHPKFDIDPSQQIFLAALPLFHAAGLVAVMGQAVAAGSPMVLVPNPRDIDDVVDIIGHFKPNAFVGVPALYNAINNHQRVKSGAVKLDSLLISSSGTAPLSPATKRTYEEISGNVITEGYGMSEALVTHANPLISPTKLNSVGLPYPDVDVRIISLDNGETILEIGEIGEIIIHSPTVMQGYHKMPTETANALREHDGRIWMHTGDIGRMDEDGYFYIVDRKKDMALIGGFNVYPTVVDNALMEHPAIADVGTAAIPHPEKVGQEALKAWIVLHEGASISEADLIAHCEQYLAPYEVPRRFAFVDELPKTAIGKVLRRELIKQEMDEN